MSQITISTVQAYAKSLLDADAAKPASPLNGIKVAVRGWGYPLPKDVQDEAFRPDGPGIFIEILYPYSTARVNVDPQSSAQLTFGLRVCVNHQPTVNRRVTGAQKDPLLIIERIWSLLCGKPVGPQAFRLGQLPLNEALEVDAGEVVSTDLEIPLPFKP